MSTFVCETTFSAQERWSMPMQPACHCFQVSATPKTVIRRRWIFEDTTDLQTRANSLESATTSSKRDEARGNVESEEVVCDLNPLFDTSSSFSTSVQEKLPVDDPDGEGEFSPSRDTSEKLPYQGARNSQDGDSTALVSQDPTQQQTRTISPELASTSSKRDEASGNDVSEENVCDLNPLFDLSSSFFTSVQEKSPVDDPDGEGEVYPNGDTSEKFPYQGSPQERLLIALQNGDFEIFENLMNNKKVKPDFKYKKLAVKKYSYKTCLEIACCIPNRSKFITALLKNKHVRPNVNRISPEPIHWAARNGFFDSLQVLVENKSTRVYAIDSKGRTALHFACLYIKKEREKDYCNCIQLLMSKMSLADINKPDINGFTAFHALLRGNRTRTGDDNTPHRRKYEKAKKEEKDTSQAEAESETEELTSIKEELEMRSRVARKLLEWSRGSLDVDSSRARGRSAREEVEKLFHELENLLPLRMDSFRFEPHTRLAQAILDGRINDFRALLDQTDVDGYPVLNPNYIFEGSFYTTCLELACEREDGEDFVLALLEAGADPNISNKVNSKYPIHVACERGYYVCLNKLLDFDADVNCVDNTGNTPLHFTLQHHTDGTTKYDNKIHNAINDWKKCFEILLNVEDLDVNKENHLGKTALMLAVEYRNKFAVEKAIYDQKHNWNINASVNGQPLFDSIPKLVQGNKNDVKERLEVLRSKLSTGFSAQSPKFNILMELLRTGNEDEFVNTLNGYLQISNGKSTLLQRAATYGLSKCAKALLDAGADPNETCSSNGVPPIHLAVSKQHFQVVKCLIENKNCNVNKTDNEKNDTALHHASRTGNLDIAVLLLRHGASLQARNKRGKLPFDKKQARLLLDECVKTNTKNRRDEKFELILDYRLLSPGGPIEQQQNNTGETRVNFSNNSSSNASIANNVPVKDTAKVVSREMDFLDMISSNEELSDLLHHPVTWSFLQLKWKRVKLLNYLNLGLYITFVAFLNIFIIVSKQESTKYSNMMNSTLNPSMNVVASKTMYALIPFTMLTSLFWTILLIREIIQLILDNENYFHSFENFMDWMVLVLSLLVIILPFRLENSEVNREILSWVNVLTIMLSCTELLILLGRLTYFAKNIEMLKVVMKSYFWPLLSYFVILVAFGLSFHTLYHESNTNVKEPSKKLNETESSDFQMWHLSIVKSLVMMTGELEFASFRERTTLSILLFVVFVLLVTLVVCNLLTGLAVSDTQKIENAAQRLRLQTRVGVVLRIERTLVNWLNRTYTPVHCIPAPQWMREQLRRTLLFADNPEDGDRVGRVKPNIKSEVLLGSGKDKVPNSTVHSRRFSGVPLGREALTRVTQILSERGSAAAPPVTLEEIDTKVKVLMKGQEQLMQELRRAAMAVGRHHLSTASTQDAGLPGDWDTDATFR